MFFLESMNVWVSRKTVVEEDGRKTVKFGLNCAKVDAVEHTKDTKNSLL